MVKIQLATGYLEVKEGTSFPLTFQVGDIRDISLRKGNFSKTITLVGSKNNNDLLNHYYDVNIVEGTFNINAITACSVIQDGVPVMEDASLQLTAVKKTQLTDGYEEHVEYEVLIKESKADFFTAINNLELTDIDFSDLNHTFDATNIVSRFSNTEVDGFKYFLPITGDVWYNSNEFKPAIFAKTYMDRIFADSGFQYNWASLSATKFDKLIIPYNGGTDNFDYSDYMVKATAGLQSFMGTFFAGTAEFNNPSVITAFTEQEDPQGLFTPLTGIYTTPLPVWSMAGMYYEYKALVSYQINLINSSGVTLYSGFNGFLTPHFYEPQLVVEGNGSIDDMQKLYTNPSPLAPSVVNGVQTATTLAPGTTTIISTTALSTLQLTSGSMAAGTLGTLGILAPKTFYIDPNTQQTYSPSWRTGSASGPACPSGTIKIEIVVTNVDLQITPSSNIAVFGGTIDVNDYVPKKIKQNDFIRGIFNMFNLYAEVDKSQPNLLNLIHRDDYYDSGKQVDWTYKLAKDQEQSLSFLPDLTSKKIILTYAEDKDNPNTLYTNAVNQIYGQAEVTFDNEYVKDVTTKAVLFSPTPIYDTVFGAYIPMILGAQPDTNIRILYDSTAEVGLTPCQAYNIFDYGTTGVAGITSYPYVGHFDNPLNPSWDLNFATCSFYYYQPLSLTENNLYNKYWRRTMGQINNGKMLTAMFNLKEPDIQSMELNDKIRIDNSWWNINRIIDYNANSNELTQVELISVDNEIELMGFVQGGASVPGNPPPIGTGNTGPIAHVSNNTIFNKKNANANVIPGLVNGMVLGKGNVVSQAIKTVAVTDDKLITENGIYTDNLTVYSKYNGLPVLPSYYAYTAIMVQVGVTPPVATELANTLGQITWYYNGVGQYQGIIESWDIGAIPSDRITVMIGNTYYDGLYNAYYSIVDNSIYIETTQIGVGLSDNYLAYTTLELKYYP